MTATVAVEQGQEVVLPRRHPVVGVGLAQLAHRVVADQGEEQARAVAALLEEGGVDAEGALAVVMELL